MSRMLITGGSGFIGTNLVANALASGHEVLNIDTKKPLFRPQHPLWTMVDLLDRGGLLATFRDFQPDVVVHLAAITDCDASNDLNDYAPNVAGVENLLDAVRQTRSVNRLIVTSTQFVCRPGYQPRSGDDYSPHTVYGQSKVLTEQATRAAGLSCAWSIIRPTNIWGPWLLRHLSFYRLLRSGLYFHPATDCTRTWGYVGNVVDQINRLIELPADIVDGLTLYVGDPPMPLRDVASAFSRGLCGRDVRTVPAWLLRSLARFGDLVRRARIPFPLHTLRYRAMTEDYVVDMDPTYAVLGSPRFSIDDGVTAVAEWLKAYDAGDDSWRPVPSPPPVAGRPRWLNIKIRVEESAERLAVAR